MRQKLREPSWFDTRWDNTDIRNDFRRRWDRLLNRAPFLDDRDRILLELAAEHHGSLSRLARLTCQTPAVLVRRLRGISRRLTDPQLQVMLDRPDGFSRFEKSCFLLHRIRKHSLRRTALDLDTTIYTLRKTLARIRDKTVILSRTPASAIASHQGPRAKGWFRLPETLDEKNESETEFKF